MKIGAHTPAFIPEPPRHAGRRPVDSSSNTASAAQAAGKPEDAGGAKAIPPGLERVQERLQAMSERTRGQSNALDRISRNIARYQETQALAGTPPSPPPPPGPETTGATAPTEPATPAPAPEASPPTADTGTPAPTPDIATA